MKYQTTLREILDNGNWDLFCEECGYSIYCINEGTANERETILLTLEEKERYFGY